MNHGFTYIWTLKFPPGKAPSGKNKKSQLPPINDPHKSYFFRRRHNGNVKIYNPNINLINTHKNILKKLANNTFTPANYNALKASVRNKNIRPLHMYIMMKNILRARHLAQNLAGNRFRAKYTNPTKNQQRVYNDSVINHARRIKEYNKLMNISKNLIKNVTGGNNNPNNLVTRYRRNLAPTNFPNVTRRQNMIRREKNRIKVHGTPVIYPGKGVEYYNRHGRIYI